MKTIYKYQIEITDEQSISLPAEAEILSVVAKDDDVFIYAMLDTNALDCKPRRLAIFGTGNPIPEDYIRFIGTVTTHEGRLVWHIFEVTKYVQ